VIGISVIVILFVLIKKLPKLKVLDVNTVPEEKSAKVRNRILVDRMKRKTDVSKAVFHKVGTPFWNICKNVCGKISKRFRDLEKKYQKEAGNTGGSTTDIKGRINSLMAETESFFKAEKYKDAEKKYIEIITLDPKNLKAYKGLGEVYINLKEYKQALETYIFVLKLEQKSGKAVAKQGKEGQKINTFTNAHELADAHIDLGEVYQMMEKYKEAMNHYKKALAFEPNNPRNLDQMIELSLIVKEKDLGLEMIARLEKTNPENQKLREYKDKVGQL